MSPGQTRGSFTVGTKLPKSLTDNTIDSNGGAKLY